LLQLPDSAAPDFNNDGYVDAADYVVWRKIDGTADGYNSWRAHFGQTVGGASGSNNASFGEPYTAVPEPAAMIQYLAAAIGGLIGRGQRHLLNHRTHEMLKLE
jgi:hypothetical protein